MKKKGVRMNQPTSSSWLSNGSGKATTRYIDASQQCNKDNNSKGHNRGKKIDQVCMHFHGSSMLGVSLSISAKSWSSKSEILLVH